MWSGSDGCGQFHHPLSSQQSREIETSHAKRVPGSPALAYHLTNPFTCVSTLRMDESVVVSVV